MKFPMCWRRSLGVDISGGAKDFVNNIAAEDSTTSHDVVRKGLSAYRHLRKVRAADGTVVLARADGTFENLGDV